LEEEELARIEETARAMDAGLRKRVERVGSTMYIAGGRGGQEEKGYSAQGHHDLLLIGFVSTLGGRASALMADDCTNQGNIVGSYSLLGPDSCAAMDSNGEIEKVVYGRSFRLNRTGSYPYLDARYSRQSCPSIAVIGLIAASLNTFGSGNRSC
jgi:hypothetical protein